MIIWNHDHSIMVMVIETTISLNVMLNVILAETFHSLCYFGF